jgi:membrane-associated phospholipid phosphatase
MEAARAKVGIGGLARAAVKLGRILLISGLVISLVFLRTSHSVVVVAASISLGLGVAILLARSHSGLLAWSVYLAGFIGFAILRTFTDETSIPVQFRYVIDADRIAGLGQVPTAELQSAVRGTVLERPLNWTTTVVYLSYFILPHVVVFGTWKFQRASHLRLITAMLACYYAGLLVSLTLPTAPPWLAAEHGDIPAVSFVARDEFKSSSSIDGAGQRVAGSNEVAAMPSLHFAITMIVVLMLWGCPRWLRWLGVIYASAMAFSLTYNGSHYVVDWVAGAVLAFVVWKLSAVSWRRPKHFARGA